MTKRTAAQDRLVSHIDNCIYQLYKDQNKKGPLVIRLSPIMAYQYFNALGYEDRDLVAYANGHFPFHVSEECGEYVFFTLNGKPLYHECGS